MQAKKYNYDRKTLQIDKELYEKSRDESKKKGQTHKYYVEKAISNHIKKA